MAGKSPAGVPSERPPAYPHGPLSPGGGRVGPGTGDFLLPPFPLGDLWRPGPHFLFHLSLFSPFVFRGLLALFTRWMGASLGDRTGGHALLGLPGLLHPAGGLVFFFLLGFLRADGGPFEI